METSTTRAEPINEVRLIGRISGEPEVRTLPSEDLLVTFRLVVDRPVDPARSKTSKRAPTVDTIDVACWSGATRRRAKSFRSGDLVEVNGSLRRRFWKAGAGAVSRCEVEAAGVSRLTRASEGASR